MTNLSDELDAAIDDVVQTYEQVLDAREGDFDDTWVKENYVQARKRLHALYQDILKHS